MMIFQTQSLTAYLVSKILRNNVAKGVIKPEHTEKLMEVKAKLNEEITARLCMMSDNLTFNEVVEAVEDQIDISEYLN